MFPKSWSLNNNYFVGGYGRHIGDLPTGTYTSQPIFPVSTPSSPSGLKVKLGSAPLSLWTFAALWIRSLSLSALPCRPFLAAGSHQAQVPPSPELDPQFSRCLHVFYVASSPVSASRFNQLCHRVGYIARAPCPVFLVSPFGVWILSNSRFFPSPSPLFWSPALPRKKRFLRLNFPLS